MNNDNAKHYTFTLAAFIIASSLIDQLTSTEQNALGNWFMLIGQTLCTNGSIKFDDDYKNHLNENIDANRLLIKTKNTIIKHINDS